MGGHQIEEAIKIEDILEEGIQIKMGDPLEGKDPLKVGGPPDDGGPLTMEDPQEMDIILDTPEDKDHWVPKDPLDL